MRGAGFSARACLNSSVTEKRARKQPMANHWLRLWHDMPTDPKWRTIARHSKQSISLVQATYLHLLVAASRNVTRGHADVTAEDLASALDCDDEQIESILAAMQGRVLDGMSLSGWETRQPKREDAGDDQGAAKSAAERKRAQREREKQREVEATGGSTAPQCHDASRNVTTDKDKDKEEDKRNTPPDPQGGRAGFDPLDLDDLPEPHQLSRNSGNNSHHLAGAVCLLVKRMGIGLANPGHPKLNALLNAGASVAQFESAIQKALAGGKNFSYALSIVEREEKEARELVAALTSKPRSLPDGARAPNKQEALEQRNRAIGREAAAAIRARAAQQGETHAN